MPAYTLDSGDRLRIVVFGQDGNHDGQQVRTTVPLNRLMLPGDTIQVEKRWF